MGSWDLVVRKKNYQEEKPKQRLVINMTPTPNSIPDQLRMLVLYYLVYLF